MSYNLKEIKDFLVEVALEAGYLIQGNTGKISYDDKKNSVDLVTDIDKAVEKLVLGRLSQRYPNYRFMGEESYLPGETQLSDDPTFIVDPIDGTTNFIHGFPHSCISLGFAVDRRPKVGVVYNPHLKQLYTGVSGQGSYLNGQKLPIRRVEEQSLTLKNALIAIEWGTDRSGTNFEAKTEAFTRLSAKDGGMVQGFRSMGSAALNLCCVASGTLDAYWEGGCYAWDVCAGWVILEEAGGRVVGGVPDLWDPALTERIYLALRPGKGQKEFTKAFWDCLTPGKDLIYKH